MKRLILSSTLSLVSLVFTCTEAFSADWKLTPVFSRDNKSLTQLNWDNGTESKPAVADDLMKLPQAFSKDALKLSEDGSFAILSVPALVISEKFYGTALVLRAGETVDKTIDGIDVEPSKFVVSDKGFYFTMIVGSNVLISYYHLDGKLETLKTVPFNSVRSGDTTIELTPAGAILKTLEQTITLSPGGVKKDPGLVFNEFNSGSLDVLYEFGAIDLVESARNGDLDIFYEDASLLDQMYFNLQQRRSRNIILWGNDGVNPESLVFQLAQALANDSVPESLKGWRLFKLNWSQFGTNGLVNVGVEKMRRLLNACRLKKVIIYFPDMENLKGLGVDKGEKGDISSTMADDLFSGRVVMIGSTSSSGVNALRDGTTFFRSFRQLEVAPPKGDALVNLLTKAARDAQENTQVHFSDEILRKIIELTDRHIYDQKQPVKSIRAIEDIAKNHAREEGNPVYEVVEQDIKLWIAAVTGVATLAESDGDKGILKFLIPENYHKEMTENLVGHDNAREAVRKSLINILGETSARGSDANGEVGVEVLFFTGPSGVGKSMMAQELARQLRKPAYGINWNILTIEGSQFKDEASVRSLFGSSAGYVGYNENGGPLYQFVKNNPQGIIVIEEIDKIHRSVMDALYKFLDDGVVQDATLKEARFTRGLIIMTSNFGSTPEARLAGQTERTNTKASEIIDDFDRWHRFNAEPLYYPEVKNYSVEDLRRTLIKQLTESGALSPQFVGRVGDNNIQIMHHFDRKEVKQIGANWLRDKKIEMKKDRNIDLVVNEDIYEWLLDQAWGKDGSRPFEQGARSVINVIKANILAQISEKMAIGNPADRKNCSWILSLEDKTVTQFGKEVVIQVPVITVVRP